MLFTKLFNKKENVEVAKAEPVEFREYYFVGSPEMSIRVPRTIRAEELRDKFKGFRCPSLEVLKAALKMMRELPQASLVVDYTGDHLDTHTGFEKKAEGVFQNTNRTYVEFWV